VRRRQARRTSSSGRDVGLDQIWRAGLALRSSSSLKIQ
jgi:hypothetical protein